MSEPPFKGFDKPKRNWFMMPNAWIDLAARADVTFAEVMVVQYIMRHTWGYAEYDIHKKITIDEFQHGRKLSKGGRMDSGVGLGETAIKEGIRLAIAHGFIEVEVDEKDLARVKKSYRIKLLEAVEDESEDTPPPDLGGRKAPPYPRKAPLRGPESAPRTEKDTLEKNHRKSASADSLPSSEGLIPGKSPNPVKQWAIEATTILWDGLSAKGMRDGQSSKRKWLEVFETFASDNWNQRGEVMKVMSWYVKNISPKWLAENRIVHAFCAKTFIDKLASLKTGMAGLAADESRRNGDDGEAPKSLHSKILHEYAREVGEWTTHVPKDAYARLESRLKEESKA